MTTKWEYKTIDIEHDSDEWSTLTELGEQGWEFVGMRLVPHHEFSAYLRTTITEEWHRFIFKRPKEQ